MLMKMSKSDTFKTAWSYARYAAKKFGGKAKEYFAECLKRAYRATEMTLNDAMYEYLSVRKLPWHAALTEGGQRAVDWLAEKFGIIALMIIGSEFTVYA
jgi:hypothetical protein